MDVFQTISCWSRQFLLRNGGGCVWQFLKRWSTLWLMWSVLRTSLLQFLLYRENSISCRFMKLVISFFARLCADDKTKYASHVCSLWNWLNYNWCGEPEGRCKPRSCLRGFLIRVASFKYERGRWWLYIYIHIYKAQGFATPTPTLHHPTI